MANGLAEAFSDQALSLSIIAPPRHNQAEIEVLYDHQPDIHALNARLAIMASLQGIKPPRLTIYELPKLDWLKKVAEDFPPLPIARWVVFGARHKKHVERYGKLPLQIDATSAFGTGEHPTTRGCLLMLNWWLRRSHGCAKRRVVAPKQRLRSHGCAKRRVVAPKQRLRNHGCAKRRVVAPNIMLDMGCGSGILAMAFCQATHGHAIGVDLDPDSVHIARANIRTNGLRPYMQVTRGYGYHAALVRRNAPYDLIMANIFAGPLCRMAYDLKRHLKPGGMAILSGLLTHQANRVIAAHRLQGLHLIKHMKIGEWSVLCLR